MPRDAYNKKLTDIQILELFDSGKYTINLETGEIFSTKTGRHLYYKSRKESKHLSTRLYSEPYHCTKRVAQIIWIVGTRSPIPPGFEVHHRDLNPENNSFPNLLCVHLIDHLKLHRTINAFKDEVPF